ncbi:MAG: hypothetical protein WCX82_04390 [archaeon]|jgi:hypothetical protein
MEFAFSNTLLLLIGVVLVIATIVIAGHFKNILMNSILGAFGFLVCFLIGVKLPMLVTIIASAIFGLAGLGVVLILRVLGIV